MHVCGTSRSSRKWGVSKINPIVPFKVNDIVINQVKLSRKRFLKLSRMVGFNSKIFRIIVKNATVAIINIPPKSISKIWIKRNIFLAVTIQHISRSPVFKISPSYNFDCFRLKKHIIYLKLKFCFDNIIIYAKNFDRNLHDSIIFRFSEHLVIKYNLDFSNVDVSSNLNVFCYFSS